MVKENIPLVKIWKKKKEKIKHRRKGKQLQTELLLTIIKYLRRAPY
jgi:hypothetical protein